jgi:Co/Zn/Cd efflux system component
MEQNNPFLSSALIVGFFISLLSTVAALGISYSIIGSEPSTSTMIMMSLVGLASCFVGAFAGIFSVRHHVKMYNAPLKMGRGSVIGLTSGVVVAIFATLFNFIWTFIDPSFTDRLLESMVQSMESIGPNGQMDATIDEIYQQFEEQKTTIGQIKALGMNAAILGALNAITGILGVKFFAPKPDDADAL